MELKAPSTENLIEQIDYTISLCDEITSICKGKIDIGVKETVPPIQQTHEKYREKLSRYFNKLLKILNIN